MKRCVFVLFSLIAGVLQAQDVQLSQFYASPLYLNPGFTGSGESARMGVNYRNQWPSLDASYNSYFAWFDYNWPRYSSGLGFMIQHDRAQLAGLNSTSIGALYSYQVNLTRNLTFRPGAYVGYSLRSINFSNLVFADMIEQTTGQVVGPTAESLPGENIGFFDMGFGGLLYTPDWWLGVSAWHLTEPNQGFATNSPLDRKYSVHGGFVIPIVPKTRTKNGERVLGPNRSITPAFEYKRQGPADQLNLGAYLTLEPVVFGLWYRGLPLIKDVEGFVNNESLIAQVGWSADGLSIGYSYDYVVSQFRGVTGGAHEISVIYTFQLGRPIPPKDWRRLPCPLL